MWVHWVPGQTNEVGRGRVTEAEDTIGLGIDTINRVWGTLVTAVVGSRERQRRGLDRKWLCGPRGLTIISLNRGLLLCADMCLSFMCPWGLRLYINSSQKY